MTTLQIRRALMAFLVTGTVSWIVVPGSSALAAPPSRTPWDLTSTEYGYSVSVSRTNAAVGAPGLNNGQGAVSVFGQTGGTWHSLATLHDPARRAQDAFGWSVSVASARTAAYLAVGETGFNSYPDIVYVYERSTGGWHLQARLRDPGSYYGDNFGGAVAITSSTLVVGASTANNQEGALYFYSRSGTTWKLRATFSDPRRNFGDGFGYSVAVSGNTAMATLNGLSYVYTTRDGRHWSQSAVITNPADPTDGFGTSVALSGATAVIGAPGNGTTFSQGAAYVFARSAGKWKAQARLVSPNGRTDDQFGQGVSISADRILVGAPNGLSNCGAAYEFLRTRTSWRLRLTQKDPHCVPGNQFGWSVSVSGRTGIFGAPDQNLAFLRPGLP